jgi:peptide chain release factor 1
VRTYNFPQNRVTDHRVGLTSHNLEMVLDGDINEFVDALILSEQALKLEETGL